MSDTYKVERHYFNNPGKNRTILSNATLAQARDHCSDPETSSKTCTKAAGKRRTRLYGPWFDSYMKE